MKHLIWILAISLTIISCKKDDDDPVTPDYSTDLVGTYVGNETYAEPAEGTIVYSNTSSTLTITRVDKNKIKVSGFYANGGSNANFDLSYGGTGLVLINPEFYVKANSTASQNSYETATKTLRIYIKHPSMNNWKFFQGVKQ